MVGGEWADSGGWATWQASSHRRQRWSLDQAHTALPLRGAAGRRLSVPTPIVLCILPHMKAQGCKGLLCGAGPAGRSERARRAVTPAGTAARQLSVRPAAQPDAGRSQFAAHLAACDCAARHSIPLLTQALDRTPLLTMKLLLVLLLSSIVVASAARAGGRPKLRNFASSAEAQESVKQMQQTVSLQAVDATAPRPPPPPPFGSSHTSTSACPVRPPLPALPLHATSQLALPNSTPTAGPQGAVC